MSETGMSDSDESVSRAKDWELVSVTSCSENLDLDYENFIFPPSLHEGLPLDIDRGNSLLGAEDFENSQLGLEEIRNSQVGISNFGNLNLGSSRDLGEGLGENVENEVSGCGRLESPEIEDGEQRRLREVRVMGVNEGESGGNEGSEDVDEGFDEGSDGEGVFGILDSIKGLGFGCPGVKRLGFGWDGVKCWGWEGWFRRQVDSFGKPNALWSITMTAALVGIVVLGHKLQREKWKNQQIRQQLRANDEKISELLCQVARLKEAISGRRKVIVVKNS